MASSFTLTGPVKLKPSTSSRHLKWKFKNGLDEPICDLWIDTNHTYGNDPDIRNVRIKKNGDDVEILSDPPDNDDDTKKHITFLDDCLEPGEEITIKIDFDATFDDDEWITFSPTDDENYVIMGPTGEMASNHTPYQTNSTISHEKCFKELERTIQKNDEEVVRVLLKNISYKDLINKISKIEGIDDSE